MATSTSLPFTGNQISMDDIKDVLYGTAASSNRSLDTMANLAGVDSIISYFSGYVVSCFTATNSMSFFSTGGPLQTASFTIQGGDATFTSTPSASWINTFDDNVSNEVSVTCDINYGGSRNGSVTVKHDNNPDIYDTFTVSQASGTTTTTTTTTTISKIIIKIETV